MRIEYRIHVYVTHLGRTGFIISLPPRDDPSYPYYTISLDFQSGKDNGQIDLARKAFKVLSDE